MSSQNIIIYCFPPMTLHTLQMNTHYKNHFLQLLILQDAVWILSHIKIAFQTIEFNWSLPFPLRTAHNSVLFCVSPFHYYLISLLEKKSALQIPLGQLTINLKVTQLFITRIYYFCAHLLLCTVLKLQFCIIVLLHFDMNMISATQ